jgi:hypothetical protein
VPLLVGLALSVIMAVLVGFLFQTRDPAIKGINHAGILQMAWLFARSPGELMMLREVDESLEEDLRTAGDQIKWRGRAEAEAWDHRSITRKRSESM